MKKTSLVLTIGLFAIGCGGTTPPAKTNAPSGPPAMGASHGAPGTPSGAHGAAKPEGEAAKPEGEAAKPEGDK